MNLSDMAQARVVKLGESPSLRECLTAYGIPAHMQQQAGRAFTTWLASWNGLGETSESLVHTLITQPWT